MIRHILLLLCLTWITACGKDEPPPPPPVQAPPPQTNPQVAPNGGCNGGGNCGGYYNGGCNRGGGVVWSGPYSSGSVEWGRSCY